MTERFTKDEFEAVLPKHRDSGQPLWTLIGLVDGEYCYSIQVRDHVRIMIRSSVMYDGYAADTAANSIRCWLVDEANLPLGNKIQKYVTRVPGWSGRLLDQLRTLYLMGLKACKPCPKCGVRVKVFMTKNGTNRGRIFLKCSALCGYFQWLDEKK